MVGKVEHIKPMLKSSRKVLIWDPETDWVEHVHPGCTQINRKPPEQVVKSEQDFFAQPKGSEPKEGGNGPHQP